MANLRCRTLCVKLKRQATAAFLGVFAFRQDVVGVCCIPTTIFGWIAWSEAGLSGSQGALSHSPWTKKPNAGRAVAAPAIRLEQTGSEQQKGHSERCGL
jgi:hypothetical protein